MEMSVVFQKQFSVFGSYLVFINNLGNDRLLIEWERKTTNHLKNYIDSDYKYRLKFKFIILTEEHNIRS